MVINKDKEIFNPNEIDIKLLFTKVIKKFSKIYELN